MRTFLRLVAQDMNKGFRACFVKYLFALAALTALSALSLYCSKGTTVPGIGDALVSLLTGITFYDPDPQRNTPFVVPNTWLLVFLLCSYITLEYPFQDLEGQGEISVLMCGSKTKWWLSKCIWVIFATAVYFILIAVAITVATIIAQGTISTEIHAEILTNTAQYYSGLAESPWNIPPLLLSMFMCACAINLIQLFASLAIKPLPAFGATAVLYILSAYFANPLLLGEYLMMARSATFVSNGYSPLLGVALAGATGFWAVIFGTLYFRQTDLMNRGES